MTKLLAPIVAAISYAAAVAALWWMVNNAHQVNGVGWLKRLGFPFDSIWLAACLGGAFGLVFGQKQQRDKERQRQKLSQISDAIDFEFDEKADDFEPPPMPLFKNRSSLDHRMSGNYNGVPVEVFDLTTVTRSSENTTYQTRTIVLLPAENLPEFSLHAKTKGFRFLNWIGVRGLTFDPTAASTDEDREVIERFGQLYHLDSGEVTRLAAGDPEAIAGKDHAARQVFTLPVLKVLAARSGWSVESQGGHLAFWQGTGARPAEERISMIGSALIIREALLQPADPSAILPAPPGDDRARQVGRTQGTLLGGVIGLLGSFFIAAIVIFTLFFGKDHRAGFGFPFEMLLFPVIVFSGGLLGAFVGSRLPLRGPLFKKPTDPKHNRRIGCAAVFGMFAGFMSGGLMGGVLIITLDLNFKNPLPLLLVFFGGMGVGTILGAVLAGMVAHYLFRPKPDLQAEDL